MAGFTDRFGAVASSYATHRPTYPPALFDYLAGIAPARRLAWDCATGTGQAATRLASFFELVVATDASAGQIESAERRGNVEYRVATAENSGLPAASVDLVTVAQALHWLALDRFFGECARVLAPGGVLAVWSYGPIRIDEPTSDRIVRHYYHDIIGPCWPPERALVETGYASIVLPFPETPAPAFAMEASWALGDLLGYLGTWSATLACARLTGVDPRAQVERPLADAWGDPATRRRVSWRLTLRLCRKDAAPQVRQADGRGGPG